MGTFWWDSSDSEVSWVEITRRPYEDIGSNLWVTNPNSVPKKLIDSPRKGSLVFHWDSSRGEFVGVSMLADRVSKSGKYGTSGITSRGGTTWRRKLTMFDEFPTGLLTLENIRRHAPLVKKIHDSLLKEHGGPLYFPFAPYGASGWKKLKPRQTYLAVCPIELKNLILLILDEYQSVNPWFENPKMIKSFSGRKNKKSIVGSKKQLNEIYKKANQDVTIAWGNGFKLNTKALEHSSRAHARIQNSLGLWLKRRGLKPFSPNANHSALFDIAWKRGSTLYICEVKSLNRVNEDQQLRLGIGQVLHYQQLMMQSQKMKVSAVLAVERQPTDHETWLAIAKRHGVKLVWKETFKELLN